MAVVEGVAPQQEDQIDPTLFPDGQCMACSQTFGENDQDSPSGHSLHVQSCKNDGKAGLCLKCYYIKRGSFGGLRLQEFAILLKENGSLKDKFRSLRRKHVHQTCLNPKSRPRHEAINVALYTTQKESKYVNFFQEGDWMSIPAYFEKHAPDHIKAKRKTLAAKKAWITKEVGLALHPDETGAEGVLILPNDGVKKVHVGGKISASKSRQSEHESAGQMREAFQREADVTQVSGNDEAAHREMLARAVDAPVEEEQVVHHPDEAMDSDEDTGIGFKPVKEEPEPPLKRHKKKGPQDPPVRTSGGSNANRSGASSQKRKASADVAGALQSAEACMSALQGFSPLAFWQGSLKGKDIEKRLQIAFDVHSTLEEQLPDPDVETVAKKLTDMATYVSDWTDVLAASRSSDNSIFNMRGMDEDDLKKFARVLPADCMHSVLYDLGKRLWEDNASGKDMHASTEFFEFILLPAGQDSEGRSGQGLQLRKLKDLEGSKVELNALLQVQSALLGAWLDFIQKSSDLDRCLHSIPEELWKPHFLRRFKQPVQGLSLELPSSQDDDQTNMTGLAGKFLVDVQRFLACRKVLGQEHLVTPSLGPELKQVVGMVKIFSARSNLMFRSNAALRTAWTQVVDVGKQQLDAESALSAGAKLKDSLARLQSFLDDVKDKPDGFTIETALPVIEKCANYAAVLVALGQSDKEGHCALKAELEDCAGKITGFMVKHEWGATLDFQDMLTNLFAWNSVWSKLQSEVLLSLKLAVVAGTIASHLGNVNGELETKARTPVLLSIYKWLAIPEEEQEDITVENCCAFAVEMTKHLSSKAMVSLNPGWLEEAKEAAERFEARLVEFAKSWAEGTWDAQGPEEVVVMFESCKYLPQPLHPIMVLAKNAHIVENLQPVELKLEDFESEMPQLVKPVKRFMALSGLDKEIKSKFLGDKVVQEVKLFEASVLAAVEKVFSWCAGVWKTVGKIVDKYRPLIPAIDTWAMDDVAWMFTGEASVDNDMHRMLDWRKENHIIVEFFHIMQSVQKCDGWKANPLRGKIMDLKKGVEAMRDQISIICSSLLVGELILHPEKYPQKLAAVRKVCKVLAQELGMARADLSPVLSNKLEEFLKTEESKETPAPKPAAKKVAKKAAAKTKA